MPSRTLVKRFQLQSGGRCGTYIPGFAAVEKGVR
jgi:hypothetical protein